jgi:hypothetical protein
MFSDPSPEERVPQGHPLQAIRVMADAVLKELSPQLTGCTPTSAAPRLPSNRCGGRCCGKSSTRYAVSGC